MEGLGEEACVSLYAHHGPPWRGRKDGRSILGRRLKGKGRHPASACVRLSRAAFVGMLEHFEGMAATRCIVDARRSIDRRWSACSSKESLSSPWPIVLSRYPRSSGRRAPQPRFVIRSRRSSMNARDRRAFCRSSSTKFRRSTNGNGRQGIEEGGPLIGRAFRKPSRS